MQSQLFELFNNCRDSEIVLFGSGRFAESFMRVYGRYRRPAYIVDNNPDTWGCEKLGLMVKNPEVLSHVNWSRIRIIIAVKDYQPIIDQLKTYGALDESIRVYDKTLPIQPIYEMGYAMAIVDDKSEEDLEYLQDFAKVCKRFVLGIPDDLIVARLFTEARGYNSQIQAERIKQWSWIDDVITLDYQHLRYPVIHSELQFDACLYGTFYGKTFEADRKYFAEHQVDFLSVVPDRRTLSREEDALGLALKGIHSNRKIILYGTGAYAKAFREQYPDCRPAYVIDSNPDMWGKYFGTLRIEPPMKLQQEDDESAVVILCARDCDAMRERIQRYGDFEYYTMLYRPEMALPEAFGVAQVLEQSYIIRAHEILYKLLKEFTEVCRENDLHYYIICGSLIGVLRHQDMVPWDDDIDIAMPRKDYNRLKKIVKKRWNSDTFKFLDYKNMGGGAFLDCMPRLFYLKEKLPTKVFKKVAGRATADVADRMFLDIYVMDNAHPNPKIHNFKMNCMKGIYNLCMGHRGNVDYDEYKDYMPERTFRFMKFLHGVGSVLPLRFLIWMYELFSQSSNNDPRCDSYFMNACAITCIERTFKKEFFEEGNWGKLHGIDVRIPKDADGLFKAMMYGGVAAIMNYPRYSIRKPSHYFNSDIEIWR